MKIKETKSLVSIVIIKEEIGTNINISNPFPEQLKDKKIR
jgi:hypothetical protein